jgi:hypothetical protein
MSPVRPASFAVTMADAFQTLGNVMAKMTAETEPTRETFVPRKHVPTSRFVTTFLSAASSKQFNFYRHIRKKILICRSFLAGSLSMRSDIPRSALCASLDI